MTREKAIETLWINKKLCLRGGHSEAADFVDKAVALGMLKLDEPKSDYQKLAEAVEGSVWREIITPVGIKGILDAAGLKIVDK